MSETTAQAVNNPNPGSNNPDQAYVEAYSAYMKRLSIPTVSFGFIPMSTGENWLRIQINACKLGKEPGSDFLQVAPKPNAVAACDALSDYRNHRGNRR